MLFIGHKTKNIVREIYDTLRDFTWIRYDDLYDFVDQINPKFNKFTWEDIGFEWDYGDAFIGDCVHESEGEIDIIYELPLDTKHYVESVRRKSKRSVNERHDPVHFLSNNPTGYERYVNYAETLVTVCENLTEAAERCLRRIEDDEEFYTDPKNERWYGFDEKMDQISKVLQQIEKIKNKINTKM